MLIGRVAVTAGMAAILGLTVYLASAGRASPARHSAVSEQAEGASVRSGSRSGDDQPLQGTMSGLAQGVSVAGTSTISVGSGLVPTTAAEPDTFAAEVLAEYNDFIGRAELSATQIEEFNKIIFELQGEIDLLRPDLKGPQPIQMKDSDGPDSRIAMSHRHFADWGQQVDSMLWTLQEELEDKVRVILTPEQRARLGANNGGYTVIYVRKLAAIEQGFIRRADTAAHPTP